jgi:hypothetical protein
MAVLHFGVLRTLRCHRRYSPLDVLTEGRSRERVVIANGSVSASAPEAVRKRRLRCDETENWSLTVLATASEGESHAAPGREEAATCSVPAPIMNSLVSPLRVFFTHTIDRPDLARKLIRQCIRATCPRC